MWILLCIKTNIIASNVESEVVGDIVDEMKTLELSCAIQEGEESAGQEQILDLTDEKIVDHCKLLKDLERLAFEWNFLVIPGSIQMERFIPLECFRKRGNLSMNWKGV